MVTPSPENSKCWCSRWRTVLIVGALFMVGFVVQAFILREDGLNFGQKYTLHILEKVFKVNRPSFPVPVRPKTGGWTDESQMQSRVKTKTSMASPALDNPSNERCWPKSHIVFLNTHQTEGRTIQNLLYRFGESRSLTFALPKNNDIRFSYPEPFKAQFVEGVNGKSANMFHILCNDMRFRKSEVVKVMPEDTFYFSILRHPVLLVQSVFMYSKVTAILPDSRILDSSVEDSLRNHSSTKDDSSFTLNNLAFDFGFDNLVTAEAKDLDERAAKAIADIERDFHLLLINEYFDESLVLFKHALCWSLEDVATLRRSNRTDQLRCSVLPDTAEDIKRYNALDWKIYQHFNATFWQRVEREVGLEEMKREVSELRELQAELTRTCLTGKVAPYPKNTWRGDDRTLGFNLNSKLKPEIKTKCQKLITPELQYTYNLYNQQFSKKTA